MKLDSRIKEGKKYLDCFDVDIAKQFIGKKGYFSHYVDNYADLKNTVLGTLGSTGNTFHESFCCTEEPLDNYYYEFFLPAEWVEQKNKITFEPYTLETFEKEFNIGDVVFFREKDDDSAEGKYYKCMYSGYIQKPANKLLILLGGWLFDFTDLFFLYEINRNGTWEPFGRKVENIDICAGS